MPLVWEHKEKEHVDRQGWVIDETLVVVEESARREG